MSIRCAIIGATGYAGYWLTHYLLAHPRAELTYLATRRDPQPDLREEFPALLGRLPSDVARGQPIDFDAMAQAADVVFLSLPHRVAMGYAPELRRRDLKVVDLSADYRLNSPEAYEAAYGHPHEDPDNLPAAVYGLTELAREVVAQAALVANPGCYPTAAALACVPLLREGLAEPNGIVINAASGVSGAGRSTKPTLHFPEHNESFYAYGTVGGHRHQPEIEQTLRARGHPDTFGTLFVPHLLPLDRGILETIYLTPSADAPANQDALDACFRRAYATEPFIRLRQGPPNVKDVRDTNFCDLHACFVAGPPARIVVFAAIDNMIKGASGQAIQNMNAMFGLPETMGLL